MRIFSRLRALSVSLSVAIPSGLAAHPHVFVDTGLTLVLDDAQRVIAVEVTWSYDDLYSLLVMQDMGLDMDGDGILTEEELAQVDGWDMQWIDGYEGDLYLTDTDGNPVALGSHIPLSTEVVDARLVSRHRRQLVEPVVANGLTLRAFDPEFYTAYDLTLGVDVPAPCTATVETPEKGAAYAEAQEVMSVFPEDAEDVPLLGHIFAETVSVSCLPAE